MKIKRFKLNALSADVLRQKEMSSIMGGNSCGCACAYNEQGGSSTSDNMQANYNYDYTSDNSTVCSFIEKSDYDDWQVVCRPKAN